jgi:ABC-type lipoprotein export system ATPase subunit
MFQQLAAAENITIVLVTHDAGVAQYARRTIRIRDGLIEDGVYAAAVRAAEAGGGPAAGSRRAG